MCIPPSAFHRRPGPWNAIKTRSRDIDVATDVCNLVARLKHIDAFQGVPGHDHGLQHDWPVTWNTSMFMIMAILVPHSETHRCLWHGARRVHTVKYIDVYGAGRNVARHEPHRCLWCATRCIHTVKHIDVYGVWYDAGALWNTSMCMVGEGVTHDVHAPCNTSMWMVRNIDWTRSRVLDRDIDWNTRLGY